jgi:uncharacterized cysteine cluster protein YcgN (CxxCxxCC family)
MKEFKMPDYETQKKTIEDNQIWIRHGYCNRCGLCCYTFKGTICEENKVGPCKYLSFDENGLAVCDNYENRHQSCKDFPLIRYSFNDRKYFEQQCTYYWTLNTGLTVEEALKRQINLCNICRDQNKYCQNRLDVINQIKKECKQE